MSGPRPDTWMPLYIGDYLADTMHLTRDQHGAYLLLIMAYWRRGGPLPDDDDRLAGIAKASAAEWRKLRPVLAEFFQVENGTWTQKRAQIELDDATKITADRSTAGSKGAAKRWRGHKQNYGNEDGKPDGKSVANASQTDAPLPSQPPKKATQLENLDAARDPAVAVIAAFDAERVAAFGEAHGRPWPAALDLTTARRWLENGADLALIAGVCRATMARRKASGKSPPDTLGYLDKPIADALATAKSPMPAGEINGAEHPPQVVEGEFYNGRMVTGPLPGQVVIGKTIDGKRMFGMAGEKPKFQPYIP